MRFFLVRLVHFVLSDAAETADKLLQFWFGFLNSDGESRPGICSPPLLEQSSSLSGLFIFRTFRIAMLPFLYLVTLFVLEGRGDEERTFVDRGEERE